jgi:hypothetical protein
VVSLIISPLFVLLAGRRNLLCIDTNLGYVAVCGVSKLLRYRVQGKSGQVSGRVGHLGKIVPRSADRIQADADRVQLISAVWDKRL